MKRNERPCMVCEGSGGHHGLFAGNSYQDASRAWSDDDDAAWASRWKGHGIRIPQSRLLRQAAN